MPKAEVGSTKYLANKMKAKGLQRLRWYCQACQRQMRDENAMKQHCLAESHVRNMQLIGEDPQKYIRQYTEEFKRDFLQLLRTSHGEKPIHINKFYQEYIANKEHVHMNATRFNSLSEFAKYLGREGVCRVTEDDKGVYIAWIDNSPGALRRRDAILKKDRQDKGDEDREQQAILDQVRRAHEQATERTEFDDEKRMLDRKEGEKVSLNFGFKPKSEATTETNTPQPASDGEGTPNAQPAPVADQSTATGLLASSSSSAAPVKLSFGTAAPKKGNVFAAAKKNPLATKKSVVKEPPKKMSEMERIMKEEMERKRQREGQGGGGKKMRIQL